MCTKTFLGFLPLRTGSLVLAYAGIASSITILIYYSLVAYNASVDFSEHNMRSGDYDADEERLSEEEEKLTHTAFGYYYILTMILCHYIVYIIFIIFSVFLAIGAHHVIRGLLIAYFVYGFIHCFFCLFLAALHYYVEEYVEAVLLIASDVVLMFCLCGVKGLMNSIDSGQVYTRHEDETTYKA